MDRQPAPAEIGMTVVLGDHASHLRWRRGLLRRHVPDPTAAPIPNLLPKPGPNLREAANDSLPLIQHVTPGAKGCWQLSLQR